MIRHLMRVRSAAASPEMFRRRRLTPAVLPFVLQEQLSEALDQLMGFCQGSRAGIASSA
jgi:hypothetical protein